MVALPGYARSMVPSGVRRLGELDMPNSASLLAIAQQFFDAVMQPAQRVSALETMVDLFQAEHAVIFAHETATGRPIISEAACMDGANFERFLLPETARWMAPFVAAMPNGRAVTLQHLTTEQEFERTALYNEVLRPANGFYHLAMRREYLGMCTMLSVCRPRRKVDFSADDVVSAQSLIPALSMGVQLQARLQIADGRCAALASALDRLDDGVILTDAAARPVFLNARAARIVAEGDGLDVTTAQVVTATPIATQRLRAAVTDVSAGAAVTGRQLRVERPSQRPPLLLTILPMAQLGAVLPGVGAPSVAIFITETDAPLAIDCAAVREIFHLTARECDVAARIAGGLALDETAADLGIGHGTVRSHLTQIYEKTGTHSQAALVALLARFTRR